MVVAGFQGDHRGTTSGQPTRPAQRHHLGVSAARPLGATDADDAAVAIQMTAPTGGFG